MTEQFNIQALIDEATAYDKKEMLERKNPRSWLKSVSAFANGGGGVLVFGITDDDKIVGLADAKQDSEDISEAVKTHMDPIPTVNLQIVEAEGKRLIVLQVVSGQETPYYFIGSGMRKVLDAYNHFRNLPTYRTPEFHSNARDFRVVLWNLNYDGNIPKDYTKEGESAAKEFTKEGYTTLKAGKEFLKEREEFLKEGKQFLKERKQFLKAQRIIYNLISKSPRITSAKMAEVMGISDRQVRKYLKRLTDLKLIAREGGRKMGEWKIIDEDYEKFFERI